MSRILSQSELRMSCAEGNKSVELLWARPMALNASRSSARASGGSFSGRIRCFVAFMPRLYAFMRMFGQELVRAQNDWSTPLPTVFFEEAPKLFKFGFRESIEPKALAPRHYSFSH